MSNNPIPLADDPTTRGYILQNVAIALIVLDISFVALRIYARAIKGRGGWIDEWMVICALISNLGLCVVAILMYQITHIGHHLPWVKKHEPLTLITFAKLDVALEMLFTVSFTFPKLAILCMYLNVFVERWQRRAVFVLIGLVAGSGLGTGITTMVQCVPLQYLWDKKGHPGGFCVNPNTFWQYSTLPNVIIDFAMFFLPIPCILKLQLSKKEKAGLAVTFMTGSIGIIICIIRMVILFQTSATDSTWNAIKFGSLTMLEGSTYLIAACLPLYRPFIQAAGRRIGGTLGSKITRTGISRGTNKGDDLELASSLKRQPAFNESGFERLHDDKAKAQVTTELRSFDSMSSQSGPRSKRIESGIQVKKEYIVENIQK
ncbi:hypothetical protein HYFRA_00001300 [Hymenoscyphus fraxineus]|uniref:Rhodopsin domain-containing protein n=1 Tax=Hymenoscyphus fraxineus TaxID=746836 RepID=A0A9N9L8E4_9HELO|nr:hypothetical protein HYFRA_00001300 [Hymenoscyphus fraxineus]